MKTHCFRGVVFCFFLLITACAHTAMRGTVAMKVSDREAHVCLGNNEVKVGDRVFFFVNECKGTGGRETGDRTCQKVKIGEGRVTRLLNEHYSVVEAAPGIKFTEGTIVERM